MVWRQSRKHVRLVVCLRSLEQDGKRRLMRCQWVWRNAGNLGWRRVPSLPHDMAAALMADLIVAAAIIIRPTSPAPVPPAQNPDHSSHHTIPYSSVLSSTYTTRVLVWDPSSVRLIRLHYHPPAASCKHAQIYHPHSTSLTRHCDFTPSTN